MEFILQPANGSASREHYSHTVDAPVYIEAVSHLLGSERDSIIDLAAQGPVAISGVTLGKTRSYDVECTRGDEVLYVEVKGTTATGDSIIRTANEVDIYTRHHLNNALILVWGIRLDRSTTPPAASGGTVEFKQLRLINHSAKVFGYNFTQRDREEVAPR